VDLEAEVHNLEEDADAREIERLTLLQNIADIQQQVEEAEMQVAALQAIVALQPLPPVQAHPEEQQGQSSLDQRARLDRHYRLRQIHLRVVVLQLVTRMPVNDNKKNCAFRCHLRDDCDSQLRSMFFRAVRMHCNPGCFMMFSDLSIVVSLDHLPIVL
jgi:hypothetical protein